MDGWMLDGWVCGWWREVLLREKEREKILDERCCGG
jgi:hypothetical protein